MAYLKILFLGNNCSKSSKIKLSFMSVGNQNYARFQLHAFDKKNNTHFFKGIVKRGEPCKCDILLVSWIVRHKRIIPSLKEWRFSYLVLTGDFPP